LGSNAVPEGDLEFLVLSRHGTSLQQY
jgi:hypothetical protein